MIVYKTTIMVKNEAINQEKMYNIWIHEKATALDQINTLSKDYTIKIKGKWFEKQVFKQDIQEVT